MSGAQGAQPKGAFTATTYTSAATAAAATGGGGAAQEQQAPRMEPRSGEDERGLPVRKLEDTVEDAAGKGGPVFGAGTEDSKPDLGLTGTGGG